MVLAFYPYNPDGCSYIGTMQGFLTNKYQVINYFHVRNGLISLNDVDCIYLNWIEDILSEDDCFFLRNAREKGISIIWVFHNRIPHDTNENESIKKVQFIAEISSKIILHSKSSLQILNDLTGCRYEEKTVYLPHPDYIGDYFGSNNLREKYGYTEKDIVFGFFGLLRPYKNIEILIEAFSYLMDEGYKNVRLLISGSKEDSDYFDIIKKKAEKCGAIVESNYISAMNMKSYLDTVDVLVLPYNKKSSMNSGAMIMGFSYGKTVVVSNIAMAEDVNNDDMYMYCYRDEMDQLDALFYAMKKAVYDGKNELEKKGNAMRKYIISHNSKKIVRERLLEIV